MGEMARRIRNLRVKSGRSLKQMSYLLEMSETSYLDIELYDDDLRIIPSMRQVQEMCNIFGVSMLDLFTDEMSPDAVFCSITFKELMQRVRDYLLSQGMTLRELEERVGWCLDSLTDCPEKIWEEPILFLENVCGTLGMDWRLVLPR